MIGLLAVALFAVAPPVDDHPMLAECLVVDPTGAKMMPVVRLNTGRHDRRFPVSGKLFLDMRYDALAGTVAVTVVKAPHAPWSLGENVVQPEHVFDVSRGNPPNGSIVLGALGAGARLQCAPLSSTRG